MSENHDDSFDTMFTDSSDKSAVETITDENSEYVQPRYHSLELPILASAVNPGQNVKCVPETPGQIFATSSDCVGGLSQDSRQFIKLANEMHNHIMSPPTMDKFLVSRFLGMKWPESYAEPKDENRKSFEVKHPGFLREIDLTRQHRDLQHVLKPIITGFDKLHLIDPDAEAVSLLLPSYTHSIQVITDKMHNITNLRRKNLFLNCPKLAPHIKLLTVDDMFDLQECVDEVFGATFRGHLIEQLRDTRQFNEELDAALPEMPPPAAAVSKSGPKPRYVPPLSLSTNILSQIVKVLSSFSLPICHPGINFLDLPEVNFRGGRIREFYRNWTLITNDAQILATIKGHKITFDQVVKFPKIWAKKPTQAESVAVANLLSAGVVELAPSKGYINNIFLIPKDSGEHRVILDMSIVNESIKYVHFKMANLGSALCLINQGDFFIKLDLKCAYDCVSIAPECRKYLQFISNGKIYQYVGFPNGLSEAPRFFTLILKPILGLLGSRGCRHCGYLDDLLLMDSNPDRLREHGAFIIQVFMFLGFIINTSKSVLVPAQEIVFLGFHLSAITMCVSLPGGKREEISKLCIDLHYRSHCSRRHLASVIGKLVSASMAIELGPLHYRGLQRLLISSEKLPWDSHLILDKNSILDLIWWSRLENLSAQSQILRQSPTLELRTDASNTGWGASLGDQRIHGHWPREIQSMQINVLELTAVLLALKQLQVHIRCKCLLIRADNTTALACIRKKGSTANPELTRISGKIWEWAVHNNIQLVVQHIPGIQNSVADLLSRQGQDQSDWKLDPSVFSSIALLRGPITLDLFASSGNCQVPRFFSWKPQQGAEKVNALLHPWPEKGAYAFPPFCLIPQVLQKIHLEGVVVTVITPVWHTAIWYPKLLSMLVAVPLLLPNRDLLTNPAGEVFRTQRGLKTRLAAWTLSGKGSQSLAFLEGLQTSSPMDIEQPQMQVMHPPSEDLVAGVLNGKSIPFHQL